MAGGIPLVSLVIVMPILPCPCAVRPSDRLGEIATDDLSSSTIWISECKNINQITCWYYKLCYAPLCSSIELDCLNLFKAEWSLVRKVPSFLVTLQEDTTRKMKIKSTSKACGHKFLVRCSNLYVVQLLLWWSAVIYVVKCSQLSGNVKPFMWWGVATCVVGCTDAAT